jgi:hypothetical protein
MEEGLNDEAPAEVSVEEEVILEVPVEEPAAEAEQPAAEVVSAKVDFQPAPNRLIIKNAEVTLTVEDTNVAINRITQAVADHGGYIISSEIWFKEFEGEDYKYATITYAVPVDRFEDSLSRLRGLAVKVENETATGQDVTDEYVDLESQLTNLKATRDRIREFLDQAANVEEALKVNDQLKSVEAEIEQVQGRMNYLFDRAAYSTITVHLLPLLPEIEPTPTPTPAPTPTPVPWKPGETVKDAGSALVSVSKVLIDLLIWILIVIIPLLLPIALVVWLVWWLINRRNKKQAAESHAIAEAAIQEQQRRRAAAAAKPEEPPQAPPPDEPPQGS